MFGLICNWTSLVSAPTAEAIVASSVNTQNLNVRPRYYTMSRTSSRTRKYTRSSRKPLVVAS